MSKSELFQQLESLSRNDLDEVAEKVDELRGGAFTTAERDLVRDRIAEYRKNPADVIDLDDAISEVLGKRK